MSQDSKDLKIKKMLLLIFFAANICFNIFSFDVLISRYIYVMLLFILGAYFSKSNKIFYLFEIPAFLYIILSQNARILRGGYLNELDVYVGALLIIIFIFMGFKTNKTVTILGLFFLFFLYFGKFIPAPIGHNGFSLKRIVSHMIYSTSGFFGTGTSVSMSYIFLFMIFGSFLKFAGLTDFIANISLSLFGNTSGGSAKVSVVSSAFMGMINGSAVANVATTGTFTIPMMKKSGYSSDFAAAVEAVSSTGGQFCPPIMGAAAFVMAEFLNINYLDIVKASIIPAILFYSGILFAVHFEAQKSNIKSSEVTINRREEFKNNFHLLIPIILLIVLIYFQANIIKAILISTANVYFVSLLRSHTRMSVKDVLDAIYEGSMESIKIGISVVMIGLIIGTESLSGLGVSVIGFITSNGVRSMILSAIIIAILSIILGMGVPGVASFVIIYTIASPLLNSYGVSYMASGLFCLIYACLSNITPPVAISSYMASSIAKSDMVKTSLTAMRLGLHGFLVPFFFLVNPYFLGEGPILEVLLYLCLGILGTFAMAISNIGYLKRDLSMFKRIIFMVGGVLLLYPEFYSSLVGFIIVVGFVILSKVGGQHEKTI